MECAVVMRRESLLLHGTLLIQVTGKPQPDGTILVFKAESVNPEREDSHLPRLLITLPLIGILLQSLVRPTVVSNILLYGFLLPAL
jgi:hypothetical protein